MVKFNPIRCSESAIPTQIEDGSLYVTNDTKKLFVDVDTERHQISDVIQIANEATLPIAPLTGKLYVALLEKSLWIYSTKWIQIASSNDYILPIATPTSLGGVKVDNESIIITEEGTISTKSGTTVDTYTKAESDILLTKKQDKFECDFPLQIQLVPSEDLLSPSPHLQLNVGEGLSIKENKLINTIDSSLLVTKEELNKKQNKLTAGNNIEIDEIFPDAVINTYEKQISNNVWEPITETENVPFGQVSFPQCFIVGTNLNSAREFKCSITIPDPQSNKTLGLIIKNFAKSNSMVSLDDSRYSYIGVENKGSLNYTIGLSAPNNLWISSKNITLLETPTQFRLKLEKLDASTKNIIWYYAINDENWIIGGTYNDTGSLFIGNISNTFAVSCTYANDTPRTINLSSFKFEYSPARDSYLEISAKVPDISTLATKTELASKADITSLNSKLDISKMFNAPVGLQHSINNGVLTIQPGYVKSKLNYLNLTDVLLTENLSTIESAVTNNNILGETIVFEQVAINSSNGKFLYYDGTNYEQQNNLVENSKGSWIFNATSSGNNSSAYPYYGYYFNEPLPPGKYKIKFNSGANNTHVKLGLAKGNLGSLVTLHQSDQLAGVQELTISLTESATCLWIVAGNYNGSAAPYATIINQQKASTQFKTYLCLNSDNTKVIKLTNDETNLTSYSDYAQIGKLSYTLQLNDPSAFPSLDLSSNYLNENFALKSMVDQLSIKVLKTENQILELQNALGNLSLLPVTAAEFAAIETKDPNKLYFIRG